MPVVTVEYDSTEAPRNDSHARNVSTHTCLRILTLGSQTAAIVRLRGHSPRVTACGFQAPKSQRVGSWIVLRAERSLAFNRWRHWEALPACQIFDGSKITSFSDFVRRESREGAVF